MSIAGMVKSIREACENGASESDLIEMIEKVARDEREACAKICDGIDCGEYPDGDFAAGLAWECAKEIRARSNV